MWYFIELIGKNSQWSLFIMLILVFVILTGRLLNLVRVKKNLKEIFISTHNENPGVASIILRPSGNEENTIRPFRWRSNQEPFLPINWRVFINPSANEVNLENLSASQTLANIEVRSENFDIERLEPLANISTNLFRFTLTIKNHSAANLKFDFEGTLQLLNYKDKFTIKRLKFKEIRSKIKEIQNASLVTNAQFIHQEFTEVGNLSALDGYISIVPDVLSYIFVFLLTFSAVTGFLIVVRELFNISGGLSDLISRF